jgi:hypothetical protein
MTYGTLDGTIAPPPPPPPPPLQSWNDGKPWTYNPPADQNATNPPDAPPINAPNVPGKKDGSSGTTSVDTPSMKVFADNINQLLAPLQKSLSLLQALPPVAAGDFHTSQVIKKMITGDAGDGMLQAGFETVLKKCIKTVTDTHEAVNKLALDYKNIDDLNKLTGQQLSRAMGDVGSDIQAVGTAGGKFGDGSN